MPGRMDEAARVCSGQVMDKHKGIDVRALEAEKGKCGCGRKMMEGLAIVTDTPALPL